MTVYIILLLYILYLCVHYDIHEYTSGIKFHKCFLCICFICMAGFSYRLGVDTIRYMYYFDQYPTLLNWEFQSFAAYSALGDPGWVILCSLCKTIIDDFTLVKIVIAIFVNGTIFWFVSKHSKKFFITLLVYYILEFWNTNFQVLRESISISFFLIAIDNLIGEKKSYLKYYTYIVPAFFFQTFAFVTLFFPLILRVNKNNIKRSVIFILLLTPFLPLLLGDIVNLGILGDRASMKLADKYLLSDGSYSASVFNIFGILQRVVISGSVLYVINKTKALIPDRLCSFGLFYAFILYMIIGFPIIVRIGNYLFVPFLICLSYFFADIVRKFNLKSVMVFMVYFLLTCQLYLDSEYVWRQFVPYSSVFTKEIDNKREAIFHEIMYE